MIEQINGGMEPAFPYSRIPINRGRSHDVQEKLPNTRIVEESLMNAKCSGQNMSRNKICVVSLHLHKIQTEKC